MIRLSANYKYYGLIAVILLEILSNLDKLVNYYFPNVFSCVSVIPTRNPQRIFVLCFMHCMLIVSTFI